MAYVIRISRIGGPEVLEFAEVAQPTPGPGEALLRQTAVGLNFVDTYQRTGLYKLSLPVVGGNEGVGIVEAVGPGVTVVKPGDRVAYQGVIGAYADWRAIAAEKLALIPDGVDDKTAAAAFLKGVTAYYLLHRTFKVGKGHTILWHAAAGGVGQIAVQWAKALGATVIGTVGGSDKVAPAKAAGCDHVLNYRSDDYVARIKEITGGIGVDVAYDSIGADTFPATLDCIRPIGMWVSFGNASGPVPAFPPLLLMQKGSLFATRPTTGNYLARRADLEEAARALFGVIADGRVKVSIGQTFALKDAAEAHRALEGRRTTGSTVLIP
jgi:NADPH2:quinone reductase